MAREKKDAAAEAEAEARKNTERVILRRVEVDLTETTGLPDELSELTFEAGAGTRVVLWAPVVDRKTGEPLVFHGSKKKVIDSYATPEDGDDRPGIYKAPTVTAWKGARPVVLPEKPKAEKLWDESAL